MKIRHRLEAPALEDMKERILDNKLTSVIIVAVATVFTVGMMKKPQQIVINNYGSND